MTALGITAEGGDGSSSDATPTHISVRAASDSRVSELPDALADPSRCFWLERPMLQTGADGRPLTL